MTPASGRLARPPPDAEAGGDAVVAVGDVVHRRRRAPRPEPRVPRQDTFQTVCSQPVGADEPEQGVGADRSRRRRRGGRPGPVQQGDELGAYGDRGEVLDQGLHPLGLDRLVTSDVPVDEGLALTSPTRPTCSSVPRRSR